MKFPLFLTLSFSAVGVITEDFVLALEFLKDEENAKNRHFYHHDDDDGPWRGMVAHWWARNGCGRTIDG